MEFLHIFGFDNNKTELITTTGNHNRTNMASHNVTFNMIGWWYAAT